MNASSTGRASGLHAANAQLVAEIQERQRMEAELRASRAQLEAILAASPDTFYTLDLETGATTFLNRDEFCGYNRSELQAPGSILFALHPDDRAAVTRQWQQFKSNGGSAPPVEYCLRDKAGEWKWIEQRMTHIAAQDDGAPRQLLVTLRDVTERKRAEEQLRERERQLSTLINNLPGVVFRVRNDANYTVDFISDKIAELTGYPADDFRENRRNLGELMHPDDREWVWNEIQKALGEHRPYELTYRIIDAHGQLKWNWERGRGIFDPHGELQAVEGFVQDITERKRAEEKQRLSEQLFSDAFHVSPAGITITRMADGKFIDANESFLRLFGFDRAEVMGRTPTELNMLGLEERAALIQEQREKGGARNAELVARSKSGGEIHMLFSSAEIAVGNEPCYLTTMIDMTDRKRVEEELRESEERYRLLVENSPYAIGVHQDGKIVFANPAALALFGAQNESELVGMPIMERLSPETRDAARERIGRMLRGETGLYPTEDSYVRLDGTRVPVEVIAAPFIHAGRPAVEVIALDITERKRAEENLRKTQEFLSVIFKNSDIGVFVVAVSERGEYRYEGINPAHERLLGIKNADLAGKTPDELEEYIGAGSVAYIKRLYDECARKRETIESEFHVPSGPAQGWWFSRLTPLVDETTGRVNRLIGSGMVITARKRAEQELERRVRELDALQQMLLDLTAERDVSLLLRKIVERAANLLGAAGGGLYLADHARQEARCVVSYGTPRDFTGAVLKFGEGAAGITIQSGTALRIDDYRRWEHRAARFEAEQPFRALVSVPLVWQSNVIGALHLLHYSPDQKFTAADLKMLTLFANHAAIAVENARLFDAAQRRVHELETLHEASIAFSELRDPEAIGARVLNTLETLMQYERGAIVARDEASGEIQLLAHAQMGLEETVYRQEFERVRGFFKLPEGITRWVAEHGEPIRTGDVHREPRYLEADPRINSELCVPLQVGGRTIGALNVESFQPDAFGADDERLLTTLARQSAVTIENARLLEELGARARELRALAAYLESAREEERAHIAREIHDEFGQLLSALKMDLAWVARRTPAEDPRHAKLRGMMQMTDEANVIVHRIASELRPGLLDDLGLAAALDWQAERFTERTEIPCEVVAEDETAALAGQAATALFRICQEALTNVARHAQASRVRVELCATAAEWVLRVEDNGRGIAPESAMRKSFGLLGMRERARALGGDVAITGEPGEGTRVTARLPRGTTI